MGRRLKRGCRADLELETRSEWFPLFSVLPSINYHPPIIITGTAAFNPLPPRRFELEGRFAGKHIHKIAGPRPLYFSRFRANRFAHQSARRSNLLALSRETSGANHELRTENCNQPYVTIPPGEAVIVVS